jgi:hypothetical protein
VFDPFAVSLLVAFNKLNKKNNDIQIDTTIQESQIKEDILPNTTNEINSEISIPEKIKIWSDSGKQNEEAKSNHSGMRPDGGISS